MAGDTKLETIAARSGFSVSTVCAVIGGSTLPPLQQVLSVAGGIGGSQRHAHGLWYAAALQAFRASQPKNPGPLAAFGIELRRAMLKEDLGPADVRRRMVEAAARFDVRSMSVGTLRRLLSGAGAMPKIVQMDLLLEVLPLQPDELQRLKARHRVLSEALEIARELGDELDGAA
ncbi:hypothetical protein [Amycolatopsis sp. NPDC051102]|uniref:hypothetical protein n=1 Tax=Amycolatopsis sp. NPDC051102 TaxID=3155163 RepID=UPI00343A5E0C